MKRVTIKDLAKMLNVSTSTVSRALTNHPDISEKTTQRIKNAAKEFNYTANFYARSFRGQNSGLIALILPEINAFFTPNLIKGINQMIDDSEYSLITFLTKDSYDREVEMLKQCVHWSVEGVLISLSQETLNLKHLDLLEANNIKTVLLDKVKDNDAFSSVTINSEKASYAAIEHLIEKKHQNILGIFGNENFSITKDRITGYKKAHDDNGLTVLDENIVTINNLSNLDDIIPAILKHNKSITAIFVMSDELLIKTIFHLQALGFSVPKDFSIISISDGVYPYLNYPNISHVLDSGKSMGEIASKHLFSLIKDFESIDNKDVLVSTKLVQLDSVALMK